MAVISLDFFLDRHLPEHQPAAARPGADHVQCRLAVGPIVRTAQGLAVEGDDLADRVRHHRPHPSEEAPPELRRVEAREDAPEGVVGGDAARQGQECPQPGRLRAPEGRHRDPAVRPAAHRAQGHRDHIQQQVVLAAIRARVGQGREMRPDAAPLLQHYPRLLASSPPTIGDSIADAATARRPLTCNCPARCNGSSA